LCSVIQREEFQALEVQPFEIKAQNPCNP